MKVKSNKKQIIYELTQEELDNIKYEYSLKGAECCADYIFQYMANAQPDTTYGILQKIQHIVTNYGTIIKFCGKDVNYLSNNSHLNIFDYLTKYILEKK